MKGSLARETVTNWLAHADIEINGSAGCDMQVHNEAVFDAVMRDGSLGLGESYMAGDWDCPRLDQFFDRVIRAGLDRQIPTARAVAAKLLAHLRNPQSEHRAWDIGRTHYDLGNALFVEMLGPSMAYSCGYWRDAQDLDQAQTAKLERICLKLGLQPGMRLLDIGCGWGSLMRHAARHHGVSCVGLTVSEQQARLGEQLCAGLDVRFALEDYRGHQGQYDRIASVGMFEHVGHRNYDAFFSAARRCLQPDGLMLLHTIGSLVRAEHLDPWIDKYIFPNGMLPAMGHIADATMDRFVVEDLENFGAYYDPTLMAWEENFSKAWPTFAHAYPPHFERMWRYYLLSCAGAFRARNLQLWQWVLSPTGVIGGYVRP